MKTVLFRPFEKYSEKTLLITGFISTTLGAFVAYAFKTRFDGAIDVHLVPEVSLQQTIQDSLVNIVCLFLFLFISTKYINKKTRAIDIFTTVLVARTPYYVLPLFNANGCLTEASVEIMQSLQTNMIDQISSTSLVLTILFGLICIAFLVWFIALLYNGFKVASNAKGSLPIVLFILSIILAEVLSKTLIYLLN